MIKGRKADRAARLVLGDAFVDGVGPVTKITRGRAPRLPTATGLKVGEMVRVHFGPRPVHWRHGNARITHVSDSQITVEID